MEALTPAQTSVLEVLDEEISKLEKVLAKVQPKIDELSKLRATRSTLLSERSLTGKVRNGSILTMESMIHAFREADTETLNVGELSAATGAPDSTVRSHLNRHKGVRYDSDGGGEWRLIGEATDDE